MDEQTICRIYEYGCLLIVKMHNTGYDTSDVIALRGLPQDAKNLRSRLYLLLDVYLIEFEECDLDSEVLKALLPTSVGCRTTGRLLTNKKTPVGTISTLCDLLIAHGATIDYSEIRVLLTTCSFSHFLYFVDKYNYYDPFATGWFWWAICAFVTF